MNRFLSILILTALLAGCGTAGVRLIPNKDATYGQVTPQIVLQEGVDPDTTIVDEVAEVVNPALEELTEKAPQNPTNVSGWLYALAAALVTAGSVAAKKYLWKK